MVKAFFTLAVILTGCLLVNKPGGAGAALVSSHVFSNHKGGCGKTTMLFHACSEYAMRHADEQVVVIDTTLRGDLSELLLGGDKGAAGKHALRAVAHLRSTTKMFMNAAAVHAAEEHADEGSSALRSIVGKMFAKDKKDGKGGLLDIEDQLVKVHEFNPAIPKNVLLCPGGSGPQTSFPQQQREAIVSTLRKCMEEHSGKFKILCDTDGDQGFSDYTKIAHALCDNCVIPLKTNVNDFSNRCIPMLEELYIQRQQGLARSQVQMIVWNEIDVYKNTASTVSGLITPPKAAQGVIGMLNSLVAEVAASYPDLFYNGAPDDRAEMQEFGGATTMCMRSFGVTGLAAAEHGIPFCSMQAGTLSGGRINYEIAGDMLKQLANNVAELADRLNDPPWGRQ